jgi:hypothetical protein
MDIKYLENLNTLDILDQIPWLYTLEDNINNKIYLSYLHKYIYQNIERRFLLELTKMEYEFLITHNNIYFIEYLLYHGTYRDKMYLYIQCAIEENDILEIISI